MVNLAAVRQGASAWHHTIQFLVISYVSLSTVVHMRNAKLLISYVPIVRLKDINPSLWVQSLYASLSVCLSVT